MKFPNCLTCNALWDAYAAATHDFFRVKSKHHVKVLAHDTDAAAELLKLVQAATARREFARSQMAAHKEAAHGIADAAVA